MKMFYEFSAELCAFAGMDAEIRLLAEFNVSPGEPRTYDHPGCDPEIEIIGFTPLESDPSVLDLSVAVHYTMMLNTDMDFDQLETAIMELETAIMENEEDWK